MVVPNGGRLPVPVPAPFSFSDPAIEVLPQIGKIFPELEHLALKPAYPLIGQQDRFCRAVRTTIASRRQALVGFGWRWMWRRRIADRAGIWRRSI